MANSAQLSDEGLARAGAFVVSSDEDRWGRKVMTSADGVWTKVSEKDTRGAWSMFESCVPAGLAVPLHLHQEQDEWFLVLDGAFVFEVAGEIYRLSAGMSLFAPRLLPHRWKKTDEADGRMLVMVQPAGSLEEFFARFAALPREQQQDFVNLSDLFRDCGMELLGPPLTEEVG